MLVLLRLLKRVSAKLKSGLRPKSRPSNGRNARNVTARNVKPRLLARKKKTSATGVKKNCAASPKRQPRSGWGMRPLFPSRQPKRHALPRGVPLKRQPRLPHRVVVRLPPCRPALAVRVWMKTKKQKLSVVLGAVSVLPLHQSQSGPAQPMISAVAA